MNNPYITNNQKELLQMILQLINNYPSIVTNIVR